MLLSLSGQPDFKNGYIITKNLDTIYGLINNQGEIANSLKCILKSSDNSKTVEYFPQDIYGYRFIDGKYYISKSVKIDSKEEKRFFEFLLHGVVDLYSFKDKGETRYFIQKPGENMIELKQTEIYFYVRDTKYQETRKDYIDSLKSLFDDAPDIKNKIESVYLDRKSLINAVCYDQKCIRYEKKLPKFQIKFGLLGGINQVSIDHKVFYYTHLDPYGGYIYDCDFKKTSNRLLGFYLNIPFLYSRNRYSFQYEGYINYNKFSSYGLNYWKTDSMQFSINYMTFYNNIFFRYDPLLWRIGPIILFGGTVNFSYDYNFEGIQLYDPFAKSIAMG